MSPQAECTRSSPRGGEKWHRGRGTHALTPCHSGPTSNPIFALFHTKNLISKHHPYATQHPYHVHPHAFSLPATLHWGVEVAFVHWVLLMSGLLNRCADRKSPVVVAGQPGKKMHQMSAERCCMRAHKQMRNTHIRTPFKALAWENVTFQTVRIEEWSLACLHCDDEARRRRTHLCCRWSGDELLQVRKSLKDYLRVTTVTRTWLFTSLFPDERFLFLKALLVFPVIFHLSFLSSLPKHPSGSLSCPPTLSPLVSPAFTFCPCSLHFFPPLLPPFVLPPHSCAEAD